MTIPVLKEINLVLFLIVILSFISRLIGVIRFTRRTLFRPWLFLYRFSFHLWRSFRCGLFISWFPFCLLTSWLPFSIRLLSRRTLSLWFWLLFRFNIFLFSFSLCFWPL